MLWVAIATIYFQIALTGLSMVGFWYSWGQIRSCGSWVEAEISLFMIFVNFFILFIRLSLIFLNMQMK